MKKTVVIGVSASIAAYKAAQIVSDLKKKDYDVHVILTKNSLNFVGEATFETLSNNKVSIDTFEKNLYHDVEHISLAKKADVFVIAPADANVIGKIANGIADDMLTTTIMAANCVKIICPAMNTNMLNNPIVQNNIKKLKEYGYIFVDSAVGRLACNDIGNGKLADISDIEEAIEANLFEKTLLNKNVIISAGATIQKIDPVRYITNFSSGKMGYSLARVARNLGANVTLVKANSNLLDPYGVNVIEALSAEDMYDVMISEYSKNDIIIMASAISDYTVDNIATQKIKKSDDFNLSLVRTKDILKKLGELKRDNQILVGFSMETNDLIENSKKKLVSKNCDLIVANNINDIGAGFKVDTNKVTLISKDEIIDLELMSKMDVSYSIFKYLENKL